MPNVNVILNLPGFSIEKASRYHPIVLDVSYYRFPHCAHCNSKAVRKKASYQRSVNHELIGHRAFKPLATLGKTFDSWKDEIACMWRFSKSNGITEGLHRKMKLIQR